MDVHAFPAIELLWHHADRIVVRMAQYQSQPGKLGGLLGEASDVGSLDVTVDQLTSGLLTLRDAVLRKRDGELTATARVSEADLRASMPYLQSVVPVASSQGQLTLRGTVDLLGVSGSLDATVRVQDGGLVLQPDIPLAGFAALTIFSDPHVEVQSVGASNAPGGFALSARARLG